MKMFFKKGATYVLVALLFVLFCVSPAQADIPQFPHALWGTLVCGGADAPAGTRVTAKSGDTIVGYIVTTQKGFYGTAEGDHLLLQGNITQVVTFVLSLGYGDVTANETIAYQSGAATELNLTSAALPGAPAPFISNLSKSPKVVLFVILICCTIIMVAFTEVVESSPSPVAVNASNPAAASEPYFNTGPSLALKSFSTIANF